MNYQFCMHTDTGQVRQNNEDAAVFDPDTRVAVLADGMGGYNAGEVASSMATAFVGTEMRRWLLEAGPNASVAAVMRALEICVANANQAILQAASSNPHYTGMGTTLVAGVFQDHRLILGHVGDSRAYRLRAGVLQQITRDHSLLQDQLDAGLITAEQASTSINKNLVTRALGVEQVMPLELHEHALLPDDVILMCSDGLTDMVDDAGIAQLLQLPLPLPQRAAELVRVANEQGGRDNICVVLVQASVQPRRSLWARWLGRP